MGGKRKQWLVAKPDKFGLEIEFGSTYEKIRSFHDARWEKQDDGSIQLRKMDCSAEFITVPISVSNGMNEIFDAVDHFYDHFDKNIETNASCGLHIHVSYPDKYGFHVLYDSDFGLWYTKKIEASADPIIMKYAQPRLTTHYCEKFYTSKEWSGRKRKQLRGVYKDASRYKTVNFNPFNHHESIEFRSFGCPNNKEDCKKIIQWLHDALIEYSISKEPKKSRTRMMEVDVEDANVECIELKSTGYWDDDGPFGTSIMARQQSFPTQYDGVTRSENYQCDNCGTEFNNTDVGSNVHPELCMRCYDGSSNEEDGEGDERTCR